MMSSNFYLTQVHVSTTTPVSHHVSMNTSQTFYLVPPLEHHDISKQIVYINFGF
jgi:hypothetical protein